MFFLVKYCKTLEEGSFRGRSDQFLWMLLFGKHPPLSPLLPLDHKWLVGNFLAIFAKKPDLWLAACV